LPAAYMFCAAHRLFSIVDWCALDHPLVIETVRSFSDHGCIWAADLLRKGKRGPKRWRAAKIYLTYMRAGLEYASPIWKGAPRTAYDDDGPDEYAERWERENPRELAEALAEYDSGTKKSEHARKTSLFEVACWQWLRWNGRAPIKIWSRERTRDARSLYNSAAVLKS
jgi:hypothetical protein